MTTHCLTCGKELTPNKFNPNKRFCDNYCSAQARRKVTRTANCAVCGIEFTRNKTAQICCSIKCACSINGKLREPDRHTTYTCQWCGNEFEGYVSRIRTHCSAHCRAMYSGTRPKVWKNPGERITKTCAICKREFIILKSGDPNGRRKCCSKECQYTYKSLVTRGKGSFRYKGGAVEYRGKNWNRQRKLAIKRDNSKCQACGKRVCRKPYDYAVHHITPYRDFHGDYLAANDLSNLITLCPVCHGKAEEGIIPVQRSLL